MFVISKIPEELKDNLFSCSPKKGMLIQKYGNITPLAIEGDVYFFTKNKDLDEAIDKIPILIRLFW